MLDSRGSQASFFMQALTLTKRSFVNMSRDFGYYWLRLVIYLLVTLCIGTIYFDVGTGYNSIMVSLRDISTYTLIGPIHVHNSNHCGDRLEDLVLLSYLASSLSCLSEVFHHLSKI